MNVELGEMYVTPTSKTVKAGNVKFVVKNAGKMLHELVIIKSDTAYDALPVTNGRVSEDGSVGEVADIEAGATKDGTFKLEPGKYILLCNISGHYAGGMRETLTVT